MMGFEITEDKQKRNEPCSCGSGLKYKKCHGDPAKRAVVTHVANEAMLLMIAQAKVDNPNIKFNEEDYRKILDNPKESVLMQFIKQFMAY